MRLKRALFAGFAALALALAPAFADPLVPTNPAGTAGGIGVTAISTSCAVAGGPITTTGTITGSLLPNDVATGSAYPFVATDCGKLIRFTDGTSRAPTLNVALFSQGNYINLKNDGAGTQTITPSAGTINGAASFPVVSGASYSIAYDAVNTNWIVSASYILGPSSATTGDLPSFSDTTGQKLGDSGVAASAVVTTSNIRAQTPGQAVPYTTPYFFAPRLMVPITGAAMGNGQMRCSYGIADQTATLSGVVVSVTTVDSGGLLQFELLAIGGWGRPSTLLGNSAATISTTTLGNITIPLVSNVQLQANTSYYWCINYNQSAGGAVIVGQNIAQAGVGAYIGSLTAANLLTAAGGINGIQITQTFGSPQSYISSTAWTDITTGGRPPYMIMTFASVP